MTRWLLHRTVPGVLTALLVVASLSPAKAADEDFLYGFNLNASLGYAVPTTDEYSNSFYFRFGGGYSFNSTLALDLSVGRFSSDINHDLDFPPGRTVADGTLKVTPLVLAAQLRYPLHQIFSTVYALAGVGYYLVDYSWDRPSKEYFREVEELYGPAGQSVSDSFGFNLGGGLDYPLGTHFLINVEGQYLFLNPDAKGAWRDLLTGELHQFNDSLDLNTWLFTAGVRYLF